MAFLLRISGYRGVLKHCNKYLVKTSVSPANALLLHPRTIVVKAHLLRSNLLPLADPFVRNLLHPTRSFMLRVKHGYLVDAAFASFMPTLAAC